MSLQIVTPPSAEPVTLDEARASSATGYADLTDAQLTAMIASARTRLERYLDRAIAEQTLALHRACFPYGRFALPWAAPLQTVETFAYRPYGGGDAVEIAEDLDYTLDPYAEPAVVYPIEGLSWPTTAAHPRAVSVTYVAGWAPADVPEPIKGAILGEVGAVAASATGSSGDIRSMSIEGLGTLTYQGVTATSAGGGGAMLQPATRTLVDSYRIPAA